MIGFIFLIIMIVFFVYECKQQDKIFKKIMKEREKEKDLQ